MKKEELPASFWKRLAFVVAFFVLTPVTLGTSLFSLVALAQSEEVETPEVVETVSFLQHPERGVQVYASLPAVQPSLTGGVEAQDARPELIRQYLERYNSPAVEYAPVFVEAADHYGLDYRLTTAIAQQESNVCKIIPPGGHNCWGWGIHSEGTLGFDSYEEGIWTVSKGIKYEYIDKGYDTVEKIMSKYTPLSNGSWARGVSKFMNDIQ